MKYDRRRPMERPRPAFAALARAAIEKHVSESRGEHAAWSVGANSVWVRWPLETTRFAYIGIHRHLNWVTGEVGMSHAPLELSALHALPGEPATPAEGYRIRLGQLLADQDRWWPTGHDENALIERLEWMALQLRVRGLGYFSRFPEPARAER